MTTRAKSVSAEEIARIEDLIGDLEKRLRRLNTSARSETQGAGNDINAFVSDTLETIMKRVRNSAGSMSDAVTDKATKLGSDAVDRIIKEIEYRPLALIAVAAGIGYLFGLSSRR